MRRPTKRELAGLKVIYPVLTVLLEAPSVSDFQGCTDLEIDAALAALGWIGGVIATADKTPHRKENR